MKKIKTLTAIVAVLAGLSISAPAKTSTVDTNPPEYKKLSRLVGQGYVYVRDGDKYLSCMFFDYDRNKDSGWTGGKFGGVDLIEYRKLIKKDDYIIWDKHPFIVIVDDDFDGYADREFIDNGKEKDGVFDEVNDLRDKKISMDDFDHRNYRTPDKT